MIQKKVCMLGAFAVGKTSLVSRFVHGIFSERYLTTIGVKVDKRDIQVGGEELRMLLWDLHGEDEFQRVRASYLRGAAGFLVVVDGTRPSTLEVAVRLGEMAREVAADAPRLMLLNKADLVSEWDLEDEALEELGAKGWELRRTSAKTGDGVEDAFASLATRMTEPT